MPLNHRIRFLLYPKVVGNQRPIVPVIFEIGDVGYGDLPPFVTNILNRSNNSSWEDVEDWIPDTCLARLREFSKSISSI